ncbi:MAG TPA: hypothetical protein VMN56_09245 [Casimicrobiaceae bacterium]|nr:hypothetical protein [Casimicrobiaceae bacterium]
MRMQRAFAYVLGGLVAACASAPLPERLDLRNIEAGSDRVKLADARPAGSRETRVVASGGTYRFLGDAAVDPPLPDLVAASLASGIPAQYRDLRIEIVRLDVGFWKDTIDTGAPILLTYPASGSPGAIAASLGVGYGLAVAVRDLRARQAAIANFEVVVEGYPVTSVDALPLTGERPSDQVLARAVQSGLRTLGEKVSAMQYWRAPYRKE